MNAHQALTKLRKAIGPKIGWRQNRNALEEAGRVEQLEKAHDLRVVEEQLKAQVDELHNKLLSDPEYQRLKKLYHDARKQRERALGMSHHYPIQVGRNGDLFFTVLVEGDNWEDVIARAKQKGILK